MDYSGTFIGLHARASVMITQIHQLAIWILIRTNISIAVILHMYLRLQNHRISHLSCFYGCKIIAYHTYPVFMAAKSSHITHILFLWLQNHRISHISWFNGCKIIAYHTYPYLMLSNKGISVSDLLPHHIHPELPSQQWHQYASVCLSDLVEKRISTYYYTTTHMEIPSWLSHTEDEVLKLSLSQKKVMIVEHIVFLSFLRQNDKMSKIILNWRKYDED